MIEPENIDPIQTVTEDVTTSISSDVSPSEISVPSTETLDVTPAAIPIIEDPAPNIHVHARPSESESIQPQGIADLNDEKVLVVGTIGYDFGTEARLDYFTQEMKGDDQHPFDPVHMAGHLNTGENMDKATAMIWTLKIDGIPVYAIEPTNQFAVLQYMRMVKFLIEQEESGIERVSIAGVITGEVRLFNGQIVPKISPVLRGMFNWNTHDLSLAVSKSVESKEQIEDFLKRVYYELRNKGMTSQERAINYSAINAYQMKEVFEDAINENLFLNRISAEVSPVSRPDSDCWDVVLEFFNPKERLNAAKKLYRYTIDVSDVMPVTVGELRSWHAY